MAVHVAQDNVRCSNCGAGNNFIARMTGLDRIFRLGAAGIFGILGARQFKCCRCNYVW